MKKEINIDGIALEIVKRKQSKQMRIRISPTKGVKVSVPYLVSFSSAEEFALQHIDWIKEKLPKMRALAKRKTFFQLGDTLPCITTDIKILHSKSARTKIENQGEEILIQMSNSVDFDSELGQQEVEKALIEALRLAAKDYLPQRLKWLAEKHGFTYRSVFVKNLKTRWGSCSSVNNINLNLHLMRLPTEMADYVLMHELQHTTVKNHSAKFWNSLESTYPGSLKLDKELNAFRVHF